MRPPQRSVTVDLRGGGERGLRPRRPGPSGRQDELVSRVAAVNPRTVVVVNAGAPVLLPWREEVSAVLLAWFPGQEFGNALADVLLGDAEPGGGCR
jgi:beta-glucosidase